MAENMTDLVGRTLGRYLVLESLAKGGMGQVYVAQDTRLERQVALKVLPTEMAADPHRLSRFEREAKALAALDHPGIVTIHSVEEEDGVRFLTMELVRGTTLQDHMAGGPLETQQLLAVAIPLADALSAAHEKGILHRDLKPANVMVTGQGRVKVLDFGLAALRPGGEAGDDCDTAELSQDGVVGTVPYMSPEQVNGRVVDARSDVFSLGVVLYEMASGQRPFQGPSSTATMVAIARDEPAPLASLGSDLPVELGHVIMQCLEKDPRQRIQSAAEVRERLEALSRELASGVSRPELPTVGHRPSRRRALVLAASLAVALGMVVLWQGSPRSRPPDAAGVKIVVLPFENLGPPDEAFFASGVTEEITARLTALSGLGVISRTSAVEYDRKGKTIPRIGHDLGVDYVLEGTVRWALPGEGRVLVTPQLIRVADDTHLWSARFERVVEDIFAVQSEIAMEVVRQLNVRLLASERQAMSTEPTVSVDAYQAYLQGVSYGHGFLAEELLRAVELFEQSVSLDPSFAVAWARLSETHSRLYHYRYDTTPNRLELARSAADRALELAPGAAETRRALAYYHYFGYRDYRAALEQLTMAARARPGDGELMADFGYIARRQGRFEEALSGFLRAFELDPRNDELATNIAITLRVMRRHAEAEQWYERSLSLAPDQLLAHAGRAVNYWMWDGDLTRAREVLERMPAQDHPYTMLHWQFQEVYERRYEELLARLARIPVQLMADQIWYYPRNLVECQCHLELGHSAEAQTACDAALAELERAAAAAPDDARIHCALGWALALLGRKEEALAAGQRAVSLCSVESDALEGPAFLQDMARISARVGDVNGALQHVERLLVIPSNLTPGMLRLDPAWDPLRQDPRFRELSGGGTANP